MKMLSFWAVAIVLLLSACQKNDDFYPENEGATITEALMDSDQQDQYNTMSPSRISCAAAMGPFNFEDYAYVDCLPGFGFCAGFPFPHEPFPMLDFNQANGEAYLGAGGSFNIEIDGSTFSQEFIDEISREDQFTISTDIEVSRDLLSEVFTCAGENPPSEAITIRAGDYPVQMRRPGPTIYTIPIAFMPFPTYIIIVIP
ncbi:MAG: hypothetical protein AAFP19_01675 [Bacteroidota bacterium]